MEAIAMSPATSASRGGKTRLGTAASGASRLKSRRMPQRSGRTHFGASRHGRPYPTWLLHHKYLEDEFGSAVVPDPAHVQGNACTTADLRFWADLASALSLFYENNVAVQELVLDNSPEADARMLQLTSRLFSESIVAMRLAACLSIDDNALPFLCAMSNLHTLDLSDNLYLTDALLERMLDTDLPKMQNLSINGCVLLTDRSLATVSRQNSRIVTLNASRNPNFTHYGANLVVLHCDNLMHLDLSACQRLDFVGVVMQAGASLFGKQELVQYAGRSIVRLKLDDNKDMRESSLDWIVGALPDLEEVSLPRVKRLGDAMVQGLAYGCPNLKKLRIQGCKRVKTEAIRALAIKSPHLTELNAASVGKLEPSAVRDLLINCTHLKSLSLSHNKGVNDSVFSELERGKGRGIMLPDLKRLSLADTSMTAFGVACLAERCRHLEHLDVSQHAYLTDAALLVVASCCSHLRSFWANDCPAVTDRGAVSICQGCKKLEVLHLSTSTRDTDAWGGRVQQFTDAVLEACLDRTRGLRELSLRNQCAIKFTSTWLQKSFKLRGGHTFIEKIDLRGCDAVSLSKMARVFRECAVLSLVLLSDEDSLPGVRGADFWTDAFSGSMYTTSHSSFPPEITLEEERGRYCDDDGSDAFSISASQSQSFDPTQSIGSLGAGSSTLTPAKRGEKGTPISLEQHSTDTLGAIPSLPKGYLALSGHPNRRALKFRDQYFRRRHDEHNAVRLIQLKYRIHAIWQRFRLRISARKIANTYHKVLRYRIIMKRVREMQIYYSARAIQRYFKLRMLPYIRAAILIQKIYRGRYAKKRVRILVLGDRAARLIQKITRGMLTRISERYILAQIYLKLPPFWRVILQMGPPETAKKGDELSRKRLYPYQVTDLIKSTAAMTEKILYEVSTDGVLAPKLPLYIPQPFDKAPYVSVDDGRKIAFFGHKEGLLWSDTEKNTERSRLKAARRRKQLQYDANGMDVYKAAERERALTQTAASAKGERQSFLASLVDGSERKPVHAFNVTFWPHTAPIQFSDTSTEQHDPLISGFDLAQNSREVLYCETCRSRLRIVHCKTCQKGFCFFCAFRTHTQLTRRNHQMEMMEPRVIKIKEPEKSLLYHVDMASQACYDLKYLVKVMKSATEVKRVKAEAKLAREFEKAEEARRLVYLRAQSEANDKHMAATEISLLYRCLKARRVVQEKRLQLALEAETAQDAKQATVTVPLQKLFRLYSTRVWFAERGQVFKIWRKRPKKRRIRLKGDPPAVPYPEIMSRVDYETRQRRHNLRTVQFEKLLELYGKCLTFLDVNIEHWQEQDALMPLIIDELELVRQKRSSEHEAMSKSTATQKATLPPHEYDLLEKELESLCVRVEIAGQRRHNVSNIRWWIAQHLRSCFRRREIVRARFLDTMARLEFVCVEAAMVGRIESHMNQRIELFKLRLGMGMASEWLSRYSTFAAIHLASLDALQETIVLEETNRLDRDNHTALELDSLMEELYQGLLAENRLLAEKVDLEVLQRSALEPGSPEALRVSEGLVLVKRKQNQLAANVIDTLKLGLQNKYGEEEDSYAIIYAFPGDDPDLPVERFDEIKAELIDPYKAPSHVKVHDFMQCYFVQPWLAELAIADVRFEEAIASKGIDLGSVEEQIKGVQLKLSDNNTKTSENKQKVIDTNNEIAIRQAAEVDPDETDDDARDRLAAISNLQASVFKWENENEVMEALSEKMRESLAPLEKRVEEITLSISQDENDIVERRVERERKTALFFKTEKEIVNELLLDLGRVQHGLDLEITALDKRLAIYKAGCEKEEFIQRVVDGDVSVIERDALCLPLNTRRFAVQDCLHAVRPRVSGPAFLLVQRISEGRMLSCQSLIKSLTKVRSLMQHEEQEIEELPRRVGGYEKAVVLFQEMLLAQRRQSSMQRELVQRKKRLMELRQTRLRAMREVKEKEEEEKKAKDDEREEARKNFVPLRKRIAKVTKQAVRDARDFVTELQHAAGTHMDPEELRMAHTIRSRNPDGAVMKPEGIRKLYLTHGKENDKAFAQSQAALEERGVPFFMKIMERPLGNQLYLWAQMTFDNKLMLTSLELGSKTPGHDRYFDPAQMEQQGFAAVTDASTDLILYVKADVTKLRAIKTFELSLSEIEENRNLVDGFESIQPNLKEFGLPEVDLWWKRIEKIKHNASETTNDIINEVIKTRALLKSNPQDRNMQALVGRLNDRLREAYEKEKKLIVKDPLKAAVDSMVLTAPELEKWMDIFSKLDKDKEGYVTLDDIFVFLEETPTSYAKEVFYSVDAVDERGQIEFGDFMRAIQTYAMFGKYEVLKFLFVFADIDKASVLTHEHFVKLLNVLNPFDKKAAKTALMAEGLNPSKEIKYKAFCEFNDRYPATMHNAFRLQDQMRSKIMGVDWWFDKLVKYKNVRRKLQQSGANIDEMAEITMKRFEDDRAKELRMTEREHKIKNEENPIRKLLLEARQLVDEFT